MAGGFAMAENFCTALKSKLSDLLHIEITIDDEADGWGATLPDYQDLCEKTLHYVLGHPELAPLMAAPIADKKPIEVSIILTDDAGIQALNREYRGKDKPTNVLSFPQIEDWSAAPSATEERSALPVLILGDIVMARETIAREALEQNKSFEDHAVHMLVHSILHLLGYDHEIESEAEAMEALEIEILRGFGIKNPYQNA